MSYENLVDNPVVLLLPKAEFHKRALRTKRKEYQERLIESPTSRSTTLQEQVVGALLDSPTGALRRLDIEGIRMKNTGLYKDDDELTFNLGSIVSLYREYTEDGITFNRLGTGLEFNIFERAALRIKRSLRRLSQP